jgi:hypothetical protein
MEILYSYSFYFRTYLIFVQYRSYIRTYSHIDLIFLVDDSGYFLTRSFFYLWHFHNKHFLSYKRTFYTYNLICMSNEKTFNISYEPCKSYFRSRHLMLFLLAFFLYYLGYLPYLPNNRLNKYCFTKHFILYYISYKSH